MAAAGVFRAVPIVFCVNQLQLHLRASSSTRPGLFYLICTMLSDPEVVYFVQPITYCCLVSSLLTARFKAIRSL